MLIRYRFPEISASSFGVLSVLVLNNINSLLNLSDRSRFSNLRLNSHQIALAVEFFNGLNESTMSNIIETLRSQALLANFYSLNGRSDILSSPVASKQWLVELRCFQTLSLASLQ